jgi:phage repressor protein C with HTH and peptisase S24 domain
MEDLAELLRRRRQALGLSQPQLARLVGVSQQAIQKVEAGETRRPRFIVELAGALGVDPTALAQGRLEERSSASTLPAANARGAQSVSGGQRDLPVYASAQAGPDGMMVTYEPIEWIERPAPLAGVPNAFAMYVVNDSMEPRYHQGDLLLIHPQRPVRRGRDVLLIKASEEAGHEAFVKELVSIDERRVVLRQLNPERRFEIERSLVQGLHLVIGAYYD